MRTASFRFRHAALTVAIAVAPASAYAQETSAIERARALGSEGAHAFERGQWEAARSLFHRARDLYPAPTLGVREARALIKLGRWVEAASVYERVAQLPLNPADPFADVETFRKAQSEAGRELAALRPRIPHVTVRLEGKFDRVTVAIDGQELPLTMIGVNREIDPGLHAIDVTFDEHRQPPSTVTLAEGETRTIVLKLADDGTSIVSMAPVDDGSRAPQTSHSAAYAVGFTTIGLGAVGIGFGIALGLAATSKHTELDGTCTGGTCPASAAAALGEFHDLRTGSTIGYVAGGILAAVGLGLVLFFPSAKTRRDAAWITPWVGLGSVGMRGSF